LEVELPVPLVCPDARQAQSPSWNTGRPLLYSLDQLSLTLPGLSLGNLSLSTPTKARTKATPYQGVWCTASISRFFPEILRFEVERTQSFCSPGCPWHGEEGGRVGGRPSSQRLRDEEGGSAALEGRNAEGTPELCSRGAGTFTDGRGRANDRCGKGTSVVGG
jgi:hypothetical protein